MTDFERPSRPRGDERGKTLTMVDSLKVNAPSSCKGMPNIAKYCKFWLSRPAKAKNSTQNRILHWFLKGIFIFAQWVCGPQVVLYKWVWSKLPNIFMIFRPKMHDFGTYMTIVQFFSNLDIFLNYNIRQFFSNYKYLHQL